MKHVVIPSLCIVFIILFQSHRLSQGMDTQFPMQNPEIFESDPCKNIDTTSSHHISFMPLLISNCWPKLQGNTQNVREFLFPKYMIHNIANTPKLYNIALDNKTYLNLDRQEQSIVSSILDGDEPQRIQGLYFFCTYPSLISQINKTPNTASQKFDARILEHCKSKTIHDMQDFFFDPSSNSQTSPYLQTFDAP